MEVHKHPHQVTHKKKFGEYLLEFVMLFLAVFLGFVAENVREHITEQHREKEYIKSMVEDLRTDSIKIDRAIGGGNRQSAGYDSLINYWYNKPYTDSSVRYMYYLYRKYIGQFSKILFTQRTIDQLRNAGGMSLVRNKNASDSIVNYYDFVAVANTQIDGFISFYQMEVLRTSYRIFDWTTMRNVPTSAFAHNILESSEKFAFLNTTVADENTFIAQLRITGAVLKNYLNMLIAQRQRCLRLINVLNERYHLENE